MKIDRRSFLSLGIGAAAGTALSPLPWKLTDDIAIWTQMWPWTPVPEDGEASYVKSVCMLCPAACGISVRKINERAIKIEGSKESPVNEGSLCILGLSGLQLLYGPARIKSPLKRIGKRGSGKWEVVSWEKAISETAEKLGKLRSDNRADSLLCISGKKQGTVAELLKRFITVFGSPNFINPLSMQDLYELTLNAMSGADAKAGFDAENSDYLLSFSSALLEGWGSPVKMTKEHSKLKDKKGKFVQIEPRLSDTAAKADRWIPIKPGTEVVLALSMAHVIIKESLYNKEFVENYSYGFDEFKKFLEEGYIPEKAANITGIGPETIISLAMEFGEASNPLAVCGRGQGDVPGALSEFASVYALNALKGNINNKGGIWEIPRPDYIKWPEIKLDKAAQSSLKQRIIRFPEDISQDNAYAGALLVYNANPLYEMADTKTVRQAFDKIPFIVSFSSFMDETANYSDFILPDHTYLEKFEDIGQPPMLNKPYIGLSKPVIKPLYDTKHAGDAIIALARASGENISLAFPWDSYEICLKETLGTKFNGLIKSGFWIDEEYAPPEWAEGFKTPSKKFEFNTIPLMKPATVLPEGDESSFPFLLIFYDSIRLANDHIGNPPFMVKAIEDTVLKGKKSFVEINSKTAKELWLAEGSEAMISTPKGKAKALVHISEGIAPGIIAMPRGLGHSGYDKFLADKGINFNDLIGPVKDESTGFDAAWGIRANIAKSQA
jgi:anaerobic selenocysteine-containing dehydrogenase